MGKQAKNSAYIGMHPQPLNR